LTSSDEWKAVISDGKESWSGRRFQWSRGRGTGPERWTTSSATKHERRWKKV